MANLNTLPPALRKYARGQPWLRAFLEITEAVRIQSKEAAIINDDRGGSQLKLWPSQWMFLETICDAIENDAREVYVLKSRQLGICLDPSTRVLTATLRWKKIQDLHVEEEIVGIDEFPEREGKGFARKMRLATVQGVQHVFHQAYRIALDDGRELICTAEHPWLARGAGYNFPQWRAIDRPGMLKLKTGASIRWITKPWDDGDFDDGWFGGMLDGEGSISKREHGAAVTIAQKPGPVWERMVSYATNREYNFGIEDDESERLTKYGNTPVPKLCFRRLDELIRLVGQTRPTRFVGNQFWRDRELPGKRSGTGWAKITSIESLDKRPMIDLQTSTGTYIAEGCVSHNTTTGLVVMVAWAALHPGLMGCLVADTEENRDNFREKLRNVVNSFPQDFIGDFGIRTNNRSFMTFTNGTQIDLLFAGKQKKNWAESKGYTFGWLTEVSKYGQPEGLDNFKPTMAQTHPERLFIFESTAAGVGNPWHDMWLAAGEDPYTKRRRFIGWWAKPANVITKSDRRFAVYGRHLPTGAETELIRNVHLLYKHHVTLEQLAWYRWREADKSQADGTLDQNEPWTESQAFIMAGYSFFQTRILNKLYEELNTNPFPYRGYAFVMGTRIFNTTMEEITDPSQIDRVELRVWEEPRPDAIYTIGCDPAYGRSEYSDRHAISVWKCYADKLVQVAEFASNNCETHHCAWVLCYLSGAYRDCVVNIELNGPGRAVMREMDNCREMCRAEVYARRIRDLEWDDFLDMARWYLYHRYDSVKGGSAYGFETTWRTKNEVMNQLRDNFTTGILDIHSLPLIEEMLTMIQTRSDIGPESPGRHKDDRVFAAAFACRAWIDQLRSRLLSEGATYEIMSQIETGEISANQQFIKRMVYDFFRTAQERSENPYEPSSWLEDRGLLP